MAGEKFPSREAEGPYRDFPRLPGWNQVMAHEGLSEQLELIMTALEPAGEQEPIGPSQLDPIGLADWVDPPGLQTRSRVYLTASGEVIDLGADGRLSLRRKHRCDRQGRPMFMIEASYNNPRSEPLATTKPTSIRAYSWKYDDRRTVAPLVGASYSEYSQPIPGLVEQSVSTYWFVPSRLLPVGENNFVTARLGAAGEITAKYLNGQLTMLAATASAPDHDPRLSLNPRPIPSRQLKIELSGGRVCAAELIDQLPKTTQPATIDIKRAGDGRLLQTNRNPLSGSVAPRTSDNSPMLYSKKTPS